MYTLSCPQTSVKNMTTSVVVTQCVNEGDDSVCEPPKGDNASKDWSGGRQFTVICASAPGVDRSCTSPQSWSHQ